MYYLGKNGQQTGPYTMEQLQAMASNGQLAPTDLVWTQGMGDWKPASSVLPALFPQGAGTPPAAGTPPPMSASVPQVPGIAAARIPNYLWQSIVVTLCCCIPFGIVAIVYSAQVNSKLIVGDAAGAQESANKAKMWCWIGFGLGLVFYVIPMILCIIGMIIGISSGQNMQPRHF